MTETSFYWNGIATGDAILAPYTSDRYHEIWKKILTRNDNEGAINGYLNKLEVVGITGGIKVLSGAALVDGLFYENSDTLSVELDDPVSNPRIDLIVVRKDWGTQTARIAVVEGDENASPTAPTVTQTSSSIWEIPLAEALITTNGTITVADSREFTIGTIFSRIGMINIEDITSDGTESSFNFSDIPQGFRHLKIEINGRSTGNAATGRQLHPINFNGDSGGNYNFQAILGIGIASSAVAFASLSTPGVAVLPNALTSSGYSGQSTIIIPNYTNSFYKTAISRYMHSGDGGTETSTIVFNSLIWRNTSPIIRINIPDVDANPGVLVAGSTATLYGFL